MIVCFCCLKDEDEDGDRITVCSDEELTAMISFVSKQPRYLDNTSLFTSLFVCLFVC